MKELLDVACEFDVIVEGICCNLSCAFLVMILIGIMDVQFLMMMPMSMIMSMLMFIFMSIRMISYINFYYFDTLTLRKFLFKVSRFKHIFFRFHMLSLCQFGRLIRLLMTTGIIYSNLQSIHLPFHVPLITSFLQSFSLSMIMPMLVQF